MTTRISPETRAKIAQAWPQILEGLAAGELVRDVLKAQGFSAGELRCYRATTTGAQAEWEAAREDSADAFMDEAMGVARRVGRIALDEKGSVIYGKDGKPLIIRPDAAHARNMLDTLKWAARIRNPRLYGDRAQLDVNVKTLDLTRIISEANARLAGAPRARVLEHNQAHGALDALPAPLARLADLL